MHGKLVANQTTKFNCSNPELLKVTISSERDTDTERCAGQEGKGGGREGGTILAGVRTAQKRVKYMQREFIQAPTGVY
jgi:hypothetical protein